MSSQANEPAAVLPYASGPSSSNAGDPPPVVGWVPSPAKAAMLCFVLSMAMHLPWLAITPIAGTEGHRIFPAHEMVESHWWLAPTLFGTPFMTKPPLHHWLIALSEVTAGRGNVFVWRLPSAITGAALCAAVCLFAGRWFGRGAGFISGMSAVGMIAIWGQSQVADIDSTNTLATAVTALCGIEILIAQPRIRWGWVAGTSLAMAATWMTKGPAGLPIILGVWIWAGVVAIREKQAGRIISPRFWLPFLIAVGIFVCWGLAARRSILQHGLPFDKRGIQEGTDRLIGKSFGVYLQSLFVMLPQLIAFGLPVSAALALFFHVNVRRKMENQQRRIALVLVAAVLISWGICVLSGMVNPRYGYPTLLPLCPLAGVVAVMAVRCYRTADWLRGIAMVTVIAFLGAAAGLAVGSWKAPHFHLLLITCVVLAGLTAAMTLRGLPRSWKAAWGLVALMVLTSVPFGVQRHWSRTTRDSGLNTAMRLREIVGEHRPVAVCGAVTSKPEAFYYADVQTHFIPEYNFTPQKVTPGIWVVLDQAERKGWLRQGVQLEKEQILCRWGTTNYFIGWYGNHRP